MADLDRGTSGSDGTCLHNDEPREYAHVPHGLVITREHHTETSIDQDTFLSEIGEYLPTRAKDTGA